MRRPAGTQAASLANNGTGRRRTRAVISPTAKIRPHLHHGPATLKAIRPPVSALDKGADLVPQRFFQQLPGKANIFAPGPEGCSKPVRRNRPTALRINPDRLTGGVSVHLLVACSKAILCSGLPG